jgi:ABC-type transport system substrate-binding protein
MTGTSRSVSLLLVRAGLAVVVLSIAGFAVWTVGDLLGQAPAQKKPRKEEEEEPPKTSRTKPKRNVIHVEDDDDSKTKPRASRPGEPEASGDLNQLAEQTTQPRIKNLFRSLAVPYDFAMFRQNSGVTVNGEPPPREMKIEPTPLYLGKDPRRYSREHIMFTQLTDSWQRGKSFDPHVYQLEAVRPYEEIAQDKVRRFLETTNDRDDAAAGSSPSRYEKLVAAEQVLRFVLGWHQSARQTDKRKGKEWEAVESSLRKQLLDAVLLEQMKVLVQDEEYERVLDLAPRLAATYPDRDDRERIFRPVAEMVRRALRDPKLPDDKKQQARDRLRDLEIDFPGSEVLQPISDTLRSEAKDLLDQAKAALKDKNEDQARRLLRSAQKAYPQLPELGAFAIELNREHPILRVGVRGQLPQYFSPAWACTDNERRAVELLFESLVKLVPDEEGGFRYRPALAESLPRVVPLGRQFQLPQNAFWSNGTALSSTDITSSLRLLQGGTGVGLSPVWGEPLDAAKGEEKDPFQVALRLRQGFIDPLALMTYKIVPDGQLVNSEEFARNPVTSGPYHLEGQRRRDDADREGLFFAANPSYGLRPAKHGAPHIEKIRFYVYTSSAEEELRSGKLDLVLDLTAKEAQQLLEKQSAGRLPIKVPLSSSAVPNRRIYFLAINNRKLPDVKLRRALAFAIDREALLDKHFRGDLKTQVHRALNGPFPAGSWACEPSLARPNKKSLDIFDADAAKNLIQGVEKPAGLKLKYPRDNPGGEDAMRDLCAQVKDLTGVILEPVPCDPYQLREDVEQRQIYDLAYYHYDFPDDSYWLAPLLGQPARADGVVNMFRFINADITRLVAETDSYRDFAVVQKYQRMIHKRLFEEMPFIPLWQLDPLLAYRLELEPNGLDPLLVFNNVEEWRVKLGK